MNEAEWLSCTHLRPMLDFLRRRASARQYRLFACACCRRIWRLLPFPVSEQMVLATERFVDGRISEEEFDAVRVATRGVNKHTGGASSCLVLGYYAARGTMHTSPRTSAFETSRMAGAAVGIIAPRTSEPISQKSGRIREEQAQTNVLRDIIGNPFRPPRLQPAWLHWNHAIVPRLVETIYEERAFDQMPILGDALEEAGCDDPQILHHCREGEHVRGCWLLDLLTDRK